MFDASSRQHGKRARSLLSLGPAAQREPAAQGSLLDLAGSQGDDPALRHRLVRSRREAELNPLLSALASRPERPPAEERSADRLDIPPESHPPVEPPPAETVEPGAVERLGGWIRSLRERIEAVQESRAAPSQEAPVAARDASADERVEPGRTARRSPPRPAEDIDGEPEMPAAPSSEYWRPMIDPLRVIGGVVRSRWIIVGATVAGALLGVAIALATPKLFEAYTELVVDPRDLKFVDRELTTTGLPSDATLALVENQVRVLTSATVLNKVVDRLGLHRDPEFNGEQGVSFGPGTAIAFLRSLLASPPDEGALEIRKHALAVENLGRSLHVERGGKTFVIVISVRTQSAEKSALIANTMTEVFIDTTGELQSETAGRANEELMQRIGALRGEVEEAERKVAAFKAENDIVDSQGRLITDDEIVKVNDQLTVARARTIELNARAASTRDLTVDAVVAGTLPEEVASAVVTELRAQYAALKQEADRVAARLGPRHPTRVDVEAQLAGARDRIAVELRRVAASVQVELTRAVQQEQELAARLAQLKARHGSLGEDLVTLREFERDATAKRAVYEAFLLRARETQEQMGINAANVTVISAAFPPLDPSGPSRSTIAAGFTIVGFMLGVGIGVARGAWTSLRENMAGRPRRRRRAPQAGSEPPPQGPSRPRGPSRGTPRSEPVTGGEGTMGFFDRFRAAGASAHRAPAEPVAAAAPPPASASPHAMAHPQPVHVAPPAPPPAYAVAHPQPVHVAPPAPPVHAMPAYAPVPPVWPQVAQPVYAQAPAPAWYGMPQPAPQPMPVMPMMAGPGGWPYPPAPPPVVPYVMAQAAGYAPPQPVAHYAPPPFQPAPQPEAVAPVRAPEPARREAAAPAWSRPGDTIDEIRDSLREVRDAMIALAQDRNRRRA